MAADGLAMLAQLMGALTRPVGPPPRPEMVPPPPPPPVPGATRSDPPLHPAETPPLPHPLLMKLDSLRPPPPLPPGAAAEPQPGSSAVWAAPGHPLSDGLFKGPFG
jgi:hypothetical protein